jgi:hypothetical protein
VRRTDKHAPDGSLSIEAVGGVAVETFAALRPTAPDAPMGFALGAATRVTFGGERWLHAWLRHTFSGEEAAPSGGVHLCARARQFSSFIVVVGRIVDATTLDPQHVFLVKNRDGKRAQQLMIY